MDNYTEFRKLLKDWTNAEEVGTRFPAFSHWGLPEPVKCPECGTTELLSDNWPPNYGGGSSGGGHTKSYGAIKAICPNCRLHISGGFALETEHDLLTWNIIKSSGKVTLNEPVPLQTHERHPGKLLTPYDMEQENYYDEHGEYLMVSYG